MKIVADENITLVESLFSSYGELVTLPGRDMTADQVRDADILLVRSVTAVNESLLSGSRVKFVGTATIGTDHLDQQYLRKSGITFASAPGCNADGVVQYVLSALCSLLPDWRLKTVSIVGCGNVGGRLNRKLTKLGVSCRGYDPFLSRKQVHNLVDFETVLHSDVICLHTPLTNSGPYPTHHMFNRAVLSRLKPGTLLLNAGRGAVIDNAALLELIEPLSLRVVLDVWEHEPAIDTALLSKVALATPHIAGYSYEGKLRGSLMIRDALADWLGCDATIPSPPSSVISLPAGSLEEAIVGSYDVRADDIRMRQALASPGVDIAVAFDALRKNYPKRYEFSHFSVQPEGDSSLSTRLRSELELLGFAF